MAEAIAGRGGCRGAPLWRERSGRRRLALHSPAQWPRPGPCTTSAPQHASLLRSIPRLLCLFALACALPLAAPEAAEAQLERHLELRGGVAVPGGNLADGYRPGRSVAANLTFPLSDRFSLRLNKGIDVFHRGAPLMAQESAVLPEASILRGGAGLAVHLLDGYGPARRFVLDLTADGGVAAFKSGREMVPVYGGGAGRVYIDFVEFAPQLTAGANIGVRLPGRHLFLGLQALVAPLDQGATANFPEISPQLRPIGTLVSFPVTLGFAAYF